LLPALLLLPLLLLPLQAALAAVPAASGVVPFRHAIYSNRPWNESYASRLGFDAIYENCNWMRRPEGCLASLKENSIRAQANNLTYIAGLYYLHWSREPDFNYTLAVTKEGQEIGIVPSPVDETYWKKVVEEPAVAIANLSVEYPIWGIAWDFELYSCDQCGFGPTPLLWRSGFYCEDSQEGCSYTYDTDALNRYANSTGNYIPDPRAIRAEDRYKWLESNGLLQDFQSWQEEEVYRLAKATEKKVHSINPNLSLGILWFYDIWQHRAILRAFVSPLAPVSAWSERTYDGYKGHRERFNEYLEMFHENGINGQVFPGFWAGKLSPWKMLTGLYRSHAHRGVYWVGQRGTGGHDQRFIPAYHTFNDLIPNQIHATGDPTFDIFIGAEATPCTDPDGMTVLLEAGSFCNAIFSHIQLITNQSTNQSSLTYVGKDLVQRELESLNLTKEELPCFIRGLEPGDLDATRIWGKITELRELSRYYQKLGQELGIEEIPGAGEVLDLSALEFNSGRYQEADIRLTLAITQAYSHVLDQLYPLVETGLKSPRESTIPLEALTTINTAKTLFSKGSERQARNQLLLGLRAWSLKVDELPRATIISIAFFTILSIIVHETEQRWRSPRNLTA
jgi:hypothetical protein